MSWYKKSSILDTLKAEGYQFNIEGVLKGENGLSITVNYQGKEIGGAVFGEGVGNHNLTPSVNEFWCHGIEIDPAFRRKGIATAIYILAEQVTGRHLIQSTDITPDAQGLWQQENRPFGNN